MDSKPKQLSVTGVVVYMCKQCVVVVVVVEYHTWRASERRDPAVTPSHRRRRPYMGSSCAKPAIGNAGDDAADGRERRRAPPGRDATPGRSILKTSSSRTSLAGEGGSAPSSPTGTVGNGGNAGSDGGGGGFGGFGVSPVTSAERLHAMGGGATTTTAATGLARKASFVKFSGLSESEDEGGNGADGGGADAGDSWRSSGSEEKESSSSKFFGWRSSGASTNAAAALSDDGSPTTQHERRQSFTSSVPVVEHGDEAHWFLSIGVDTHKAAARVMESRLAAARVEEQRLLELVVQAEKATKQAEEDAQRQREDEEEEEPKEGLAETGSKGLSTLMPWDVMVTVARAREGDARAAAKKASLVVKKLAHSVAIWELKSAKRAYNDVQEHLRKMEEKKGRRVAAAARARATYESAKDESEQELQNLRALDDARLAADVKMAEASARMHAARTALKNSRDRKKGILQTFRQAVRGSMDSSIELLEFRQTEFALRATNVTTAMFNAYDHMTTRLEEALMNAIDAVGTKSSRKQDDSFDIEAAAALTARDRAEASLNDATSQCMAEMRALESSTRVLLVGVDEDIKNGIEEYYAAADGERTSYIAAQRATIAWKMAHAAGKVYEEAYAATKSMAAEAETFASALDAEIAELVADLAVAKDRLKAAADVESSLLREADAAQVAVDDVHEGSISPSDSTPSRRQSVKNVFDVINKFSYMVRDNSARGNHDTTASLKNLSMQAGLDAFTADEANERLSMLGFATYPDADTTVESIMEKAQELEKSQDVQTLTRTVSRNAMAYNPIQNLNS